MSRIEMTAAQGLPAPKLEALIEMMFLAAFADGEFSDLEHEHFVRSLESLTSSRLTTLELDELLGRIQRALNEEGREARLRSVKERLPEVGARKVALSLAIGIAAVDGIIRTTEREMILETAEALDIERDEAADLVRQLAP